MSKNALSLVGLFCCLVALTIQVFPDAAFRAGVNVGSAWYVFGFGLFLIIMAAFTGTHSTDRRDRR